MNYEGIHFNEAFYKGKSEKDFIKNEKHHFENDPRAAEKLKEAYNIINPPKKVGKSEEAAG